MTDAEKIDRVLDIVLRCFTSTLDRLGGEEARADAFKESDHPRAEDGKFGSGGGGSSAPVARKPLVATKAGADGARVMHDGSPLPEHIVALKLPPAWSDVKVADDPKSPLQAQGKDAKGRLQSVYSKEFSATQAAAKFARVEALRKQFSSITEQNAKGQSSSDPKIKDSADCLDLIMKMGVRPGSDDDTGADKKAYGATTLKGEHVKIDGDKVTLQFTGKKGVALHLEVDDSTLAANLRERAEKAGPEGALYPNTNDKRLLDYTHTMGDGSFKTKDMRTHLGTKTAADMVAAMEPPKDAKQYQATVKKIAVAVSKKLGNTPTIALQSYINPTVFAAWGMAA